MGMSRLRIPGLPRGGGDRVEADVGEERRDSAGGRDSTRVPMGRKGNAEFWAATWRNACG